MAKVLKHRVTGALMSACRGREENDEWELVEVKKPTAKPKPKAKAKAKAKAKSEEPAKVAEPTPVGDDDIDGLIDDAVDN
jgi:hypothetical protein